MKTSSLLLRGLAVAITAAFAAGAAAGDPYQYLKTLAPAAQPFSPTGAAFDPVNRLYYVVDRINDRIRIYDKTGGFLTAFGATGTLDGQFQFPYYLAVDAVRRRLFVTDSDNSRIHIFDISAPADQLARQGVPVVGGIPVFRTGTKMRAWPTGVATDAATGNVAVVADGRSVQVFQPDGTLLRAFPTDGPVPEELHRETTALGLAFDSSTRKYFVTDSYHPNGWSDGNPRVDRVLVFDSTGKFEREFGRGQLRNPLDVTIDSATHEILVSDQQRVVIFDGGGTLRGEFGSSGPMPDLLYHSVAVDPTTHDVVSTDWAGDRVLMFAANVERSGRVVEYVDTKDFPNSPGGHFFYTVDGTPEAAAVDSGAAGAWTRTGFSFRIGGDIPVCRFYGSTSPGPNSHFYTIDSAECSAVSASQVFPRPGVVPQWNYEGLSFTASLPQGSGQAARCAADEVPLYRAYNNAYENGVKNPWDSNHRFSTDPSLIQSMVANFGWTNEGVKMCVSR